MHGKRTYSTSAKNEEELENYIRNKINIEVSSRAPSIIKNLDDINNHSAEIIDFLEQELTNYNFEYKSQNIIIIDFKISDIQLN